MTTNIKTTELRLKRFGARIRAIRLERNISQEKLAELADVHRTYIGMIERGEKNITLLTLFRLADALNMKPVELLEDF